MPLVVVFMTSSTVFSHTDLPQGEYHIFIYLLATKNDKKKMKRVEEQEENNCVSP